MHLNNPQGDHSPNTLLISCHFQSRFKLSRARVTINFATKVPQICKYLECKHFKQCHHTQEDIDYEDILQPNMYETLLY